MSLQSADGSAIADSDTDGLRLFDELKTLYNLIPTRISTPLASHVICMKTRRNTLCSIKHVTMSSAITWTRIAHLQQFLAYLLLRV